jgi:hypothetical protein
MEAHTRHRCGRTTIATLVFVLLAVVSCSREQSSKQDHASEAAAAESQYALVAAQALFETDHLDEALAHLDTADPLHTELRKQIEAELARIAVIEKFDSWSVGPAKINRSPKQTQRLCKRRGGSWIVVDDELSVCSEEGKLAIIRARGGSAIHLTGMYTSDYIALRNPGLYENELGLLRESFGEPSHTTDDASSPLEWLVPGDRKARISRTGDGDVFLVVGLVSGFTDDAGAVVNAVDQALRRHSAAQQRATAERPRDQTMLSRLLRSGWQCETFAFRLLPGGRGRLVEGMPRFGHLRHYNINQYYAEVRDSKLILGLYYGASGEAVLHITSVDYTALWFGNGSNSHRCEATSSI